jgi:hypothetical protein
MFARERTMLDVLMLILGVGMFVAFLGYTTLCAKM